VRPHRIPRRSALGALALTVAVALAGCGSGTGDATSEADLGGAVTGSQVPRSTSTTGRPATTATTDDPADPTTSLPEACTLLTRADVEAAFGESALNVTDTPDECWWSSADDLRTANLIRRADDLDTWRAGYDNATWQPNDLGDEGYTSTALGSVVWRVGEAQYEVNVIYSTSGDERGDARTLAPRAAARL
jgi:hypothetical protein